MSVGQFCWVVCLTGLPFAALILGPFFDVWHGQALWMQTWVLMCFSLAISEGLTPVPRALSGWVAWVSLSALASWSWTIWQLKAYPSGALMGLMHLVLLLMAVLAFVSLMDRQALTRLCQWLAWSGVVVLGYCGLQAMNWDPFYRSIGATDAQHPHLHDLVVGVMGNRSHLGAHLAFLLPLFLMQPGWFWIMLSGVTGGLLLWSHSIGAVAAGIIAALWMLWFRSRRSFWIGSSVSVVGLILFLWLTPNPLGDDGRWAAWSAYWNLIPDRPQGYGPGFLMEYSKTIAHGHALFQWRHAHNEWLQLLVEQGVPGLGCAGWMLWDISRRAWRLPKTPLAVGLIGVGLAVLINSLVNFPFHLVVLGSFALLAYAGVLVLDGDSQS